MEITASSKFQTQRGTTTIMTSNNHTATAICRPNDEDESAMREFQRFCLELQGLKIAGYDEGKRQSVLSQGVSAITRQS
jgi:hypothetical protein